MTVDLKDELLGKKVTFFRRKMNWPLKTLAAGLDVSIQQLQRYQKSLRLIYHVSLKILKLIQSKKKMSTMFCL